LSCFSSLPPDPPLLSANSSTATGSTHMHTQTHTHTIVGW
jgi:hypothetical protein